MYLANGRTNLGRYQDPRFGQWWWPQALETKGHRPSPFRFNPQPDLARRRHCFLALTGEENYSKQLNLKAANARLFVRLSA